MKKLAKAKLAEEIAKVTPWQIAITDEHGPLAPMFNALENNKAKMWAVVGVLTEGAERLFKYWETLNDDAANGRVPDEDTVANINRAILIMGGAANKSEWEKDGQGIGANGYYARSVTDPHKLMIDQLKEWIAVRNDINGGSITVKPLDASSVGAWLDEIFETIQDVSHHNPFEEVKKAVEGIEKELKEFQEKADKFFKDVPEGKEVLVDLKDEKSKIDFARRLLGVSGGDNSLITPAKAMSDLRNKSRTAVKNSLDYFSTLLRFNQLIAGVMNDTVSLSVHWSKVLYAVSSEAIKDFKESNQEVPTDLQDAHDALKKVQ